MTTPQLSATTKAIRKDFVNHLAQRYVIDESGNYPRVIRTSGRSSNLSSLTFKFAPWSKGKPERQIPTEEYGLFQSGLESYIRGHLDQVCGISFKPINTRSFVDNKGDRLLNKYIEYAPPRPANFEAAKAVLDAYAARLFHQNPEDRKFVLQFCGDIIQNPARRPQFGLIMRGFGGTGKSSLTSLLKVALGGRYVWSESSYTPAFKQFAEVLPNNIVVSFDDATAGKSTYEDLKLAITRATANVEIKGQQDIVEREVYARVFIISNSHRPFLMRSDDRRFYVTEYLDHMVDESESSEYYERFTAFWNDPANAAAIYWWFRDIDLTEFAAHSCPKTAARSQLINMSTSSADTAIAEFLGGKPIMHIDANGETVSETPPKRTVFYVRQLEEFLKNQQVPEMPTDMLNRKLTEAGYETKRRTVAGCNNGKQIDLWQAIIPGQSRAPALTPEQVEAISYAYNNPF